jgi:hypothetical protein
MFGGGLEWRPMPTPGCSAIEEEEECSLLFYKVTILVLIKTDLGALDGCVR